jgi:hypothetical protein
MLVSSINTAVPVGPLMSGFTLVLVSKAFQGVPYGLPASSAKMTVYERVVGPWQCLLSCPVYAQVLVGLHRSESFSVMDAAVQLSTHYL